MDSAAVRGLTSPTNTAGIRPPLPAASASGRDRAATLRVCGRAPGGGMDKIQQIIAQENGKESKGGFGPPPPTDRSEGGGFVNLSFRDTDMQDGYTEAQKSMDETDDLPTPFQKSIVTAKDLGGRVDMVDSDGDGAQPRRSIWDTTNPMEESDGSEGRRYLVLMAAMFGAGVARRVWASHRTETN